ncbi:CoB--CoM heterodisulfide reductase iron-sulfur subunit B family protein [Patescibacteria group bacterium]
MGRNEEKIRYAYFPGCASKQLTSDYNDATRLACKELGIELVDIPQFSCCGAGVVKEVDGKFNTDMNERNFEHSKAKGLDIMTICSTCVINLRKDLFKLRNKGKFEDFNVKHWLWVLTEDFGIERLKKAIKKPLTGVKVATYYGCHILRPSKYVKDHQKTDNPYNFEEFVEALGGTPVDLPSKIDCCGFHVNMVDSKAANKMSGKYLEDAIDGRADLIITNCPFCHMQMDLFQNKYKIPVLHMSELLCMALGIKKRHH